MARVISIDSQAVMSCVNKALSNDVLIQAHDAYVKTMAETGGAVGMALRAMVGPIQASVITEILANSKLEPHS